MRTSRPCSGVLRALTLRGAGELCCTVLSRIFSLFFPFFFLFWCTSTARARTLVIEHHRSTRRLDGHEDAIDCVAAHGDACATGGWDAAVRVWRWRRLLEDAEAEPGTEPGKRARGAAAGAASCPVATEAAAVLTGHTAAVSGVAWAAPERLVSSSWDHGLRRWDVARAQHTDAMATGKALLCVAVLGQGGGVVAAGGADGVLRIWDSREHNSETLVRSFVWETPRGHARRRCVRRAACWCAVRIAGASGVTMHPQRPSCHFRSCEAAAGTQGVPHELRGHDVRRLAARQRDCSGHRLA